MTPRCLGLPATKSVSESEINFSYDGDMYQLPTRNDSLVQEVLRNLSMLWCFLREKRAIERRPPFPLSLIFLLPAFLEKTATKWWHQTRNVAPLRVDLSA